MRIAVGFILSAAVVSVGCKSGETISSAEDDRDPELAMCVLALRVVDKTTGDSVPRITGANYRQSPESIAVSLHSRNSLSRTASQKMAATEGIVLASWIAPADHPGHLEISALGYEPAFVEPTMSERHRGGTRGAHFVEGIDGILRTVRMKRSEQGAVSDPPPAPSSAEPSTE